ncbi:GAF domain-containing sensor histidine kinase [Streptomyces tubercidicus]|uniref:Histidine kinase n=1 Tax=Streptomyces tubercidicus TaxID=47759 RepID=A0A640V4F2_9ACTN|nr:GAF domain-containing protein [Streptomyces tubercidicus]WAU15883.1 GAF domain-containing protein [Streptomyces tubercidicus]GFE41775.1 histidine kinase [Streptomyces tubercidicus]
MVGDHGSGRHDTARRRLDALPDELQQRLDALRQGPGDPVNLLLEAVLSVGRELDLPQVLRRIVEAAVVLVDAEYGALGVVSEGTRLSQFLPVGVTDAQQQAIGRLPEGHGLLGELIRHPRPLRLPELSRHPSSYGFPPHHPPMRSFLGVPIRVGDEVFGNLYLTEKRGGGDFDAEDETVLSTLAVAAGVAVENARLYEEARYRQRWQEANGEIVARLLLPGADEMAALGLIVDQAREILTADLGVIAVPEPDGAALHVALASGVDAEAHRGLLLPRQGSFMGAALDRREPMISTEVEKDPRITAGPPRWMGLGPAVAVPMITGGRPRGVLLVARVRERPPFTELETGPLLTFAGQAALAMELADRRRSAEQLTLLQDRDRIARDLHDLAIQRLFATGMTLQSAVRFVDHPAASERLLRAVDDLDETIKIIRSTIFGLRTSGRPGHGLRGRIVTAVEQAARALGFTPSLRMQGLIDTDVPADIAEHVVAVLGEALSNAARHAHATAVEVSLAVGGGALSLSVTDNGVGLPRHGRRSGLSNLAKRAESVGGELTLETPAQGGTRLLWQAPLPSS